MADEGPTTVGSIRGKVDLDIAGALAKIEEVKAAAAGLGDSGGRATFDTASALADIDKLKRQVADLNHDVARVEVDADGAAAFAELERIDAKAKEVGRDSPTVKIRTDAAGAAQDVGKVESAARRAGAAEDDLGKKIQGAAREQADFRAVAIRSLLEISPAAIPVAAAFVGIGGAATAMGAAGVLAVAGIVRGLKDGTQVGQEYRGVVGRLTDDVHNLQDAAANGLLPGVQSTADRLAKSMPELTSLTGHFADRLGQIAPTALDAVLTMLERSVPLLDKGADYLERFVKGVDGFAHGNGFGDFLKYASDELPEVEKFLGDVLRLAGNLLSALAPLGSVTLPALDGIVNAVDDIITELKPLVPIIGSVYLAFRAWTGVTAVFGLMEAGLAKIGVGAGVAAAEVVAGDAEMVAANEAVEASSVAAGDGFAGMGAKATGLLAKLGPLKSVLGAVGLAAGMALGDSFETATPGKNGVPDPDGLSNYNGKAGSGGFKDPSAGFDGGGGKFKSAAADALGLSSAMDGVARSYLKAQAAEAAAAKGIDMVVSSGDAEKDSIAAVSAGLKRSKGAWDDNTTAGRQNREAVQAAVTAIQAHGAAINADGKHTVEAAISNDKMGISLEKTMEGFGVSKSAAESYVGKLLGIPKNRTTEAQLKIDQAIQNAQKAKTAADDWARGDYKAALKADPAYAKTAIKEAMSAGHQFSEAEYEALLKADPADAKTAAKTASSAAKSYMNGNYRAALKADPSLANSNIGQVKKNAEQFGDLHPSPTLSATDAASGTVRSVQGTIDGLHGKTVTLSVKYDGGGGKFATGGTIPMATGGSIVQQVRGLAVGGPGMAGTVTGAGTASSDSAGLYRLAAGEEVISNLWGQADRWRPLLKAINAGRIDSRVFEQMAAHVSNRRVSTTHTTIAPEIHVHNPVAVDPVQQAGEAAQLALAYAGLA